MNIKLNRVYGTIGKLVVYDIVIDLLVAVVDLTKEEIKKRKEEKES